MSKLTTTIVAAIFASGAITGAPAWADRGDSRYGHSERQFPADRHHDNRDRNWILGLGLLAGTAMMIAATEARPATYTAPVPVYNRPIVYATAPIVVYPAEPVVYFPPSPPITAYANPGNQWWYYCAQPTGYHPFVKHCPTGWTRVSRIPPG